MAKGSDNDYPSVLFTEQGSAPATPAAGKRRIYWKTDNKFYVRDESGTETEIGAGGVARSGSTTDEHLAVWNGSDADSIKDGGVVPAAGVPWYGQATITAPPAVSGFTWVNQGSATVNEASSTVYMTIASDVSAAAHFLKKSKTGTYTITALMGYSVNDSGTQQYGFVWRESGSGSIIYFGPAYDAGIRLGVIKYTNTSGGGASYYKSTALPVYNNPLWLRIQVDSSNRICYYSQDGLTWITWHTVSKTDFMTADEVGYGLCSQTSSSTPYGGTLFSWTEA